MASKEKKSKIVKVSDTHVTLTKYPARNVFTLIVTVLLTILFAAWVWAALRRGELPWYAIALPMIFIGVLTTLLQPEEEWNYSPWQDATQKYEKNIYD
jgi:cbb3-type cytochrome oxidase subunit 3